MCCLPSVRKCDQCWSVPGLHSATRPSVTDILRTTSNERCDLTSRNVNIFRHFSPKPKTCLSPIEISLLFRHSGVILPGFWHHSHHCFGQRPDIILNILSSQDSLDKSANLPPACMRNSMEQSMLPESERSFSTTG